VKRSQEMVRELNVTSVALPLLFKVPVFTAEPELNVNCAFKTCTPVTGRS
jgi:hypothetical protein